MKWIIGIAFIFLIFQGCTKSLKAPLPPIVESSPIYVPEKLNEELAEPPFWVLAKRRGVSEYFENRALFGVGNSFGEKESEELFTSANDRARNHLAGLFRSFQQSLAESFSSAGVNKVNHINAGNENVSSGIQKITATLLMEVAIVEHWQDPSGDQVYSLAKLDINKFYQRLNNYPSFSKITQEAIKKRSDKLFRDMEQALDRKNIMTKKGVGYEKQSGRFYLY